jgi:hypothetical protein
VKPSVVGEVGLEPTILAERDFESRAYTNSATRPKDHFTPKTTLFIVQ